MFKGLRNRFIIMHMGIVALLVFVFFGAVLISNYQNMERNSNMMLERATTPIHNEAPPANDRAADKGAPPPSDAGFRGGDVRERFSPVFTVELDENKSIKKVNSMFTLDDSFYQEVTQLALAKNQDRAKVKYNGSYFKYKIASGKIVFLDITKEMQMFMNTVYTFLWIAVPLLFVMFFISLYFANRSIKPIEDSYNRQKEFIADASHELKTPLAVISTNVDMLLDDANGDQQKWLYYIKQETERMANLTGSLLYLTRLDYIKEKSTHETFNFSKLIEDYLLPLEATFYENKIKTKIDILPNVKINGDSEQIRRLVGTLIDNAIKYTDGYIRILLEKSASDAQLTIYNTGKGIKREELEKIWDRFYRGDKSRESTGGFGLGLSIAKAITEKHKGSITAESLENEWTRFTVKIPLAH